MFHIGILKQITRLHLRFEFPNYALNEEKIASSFPDTLIGFISNAKISWSKYMHTNNRFDIKHGDYN